MSIIQSKSRKKHKLEKNSQREMLDFEKIRFLNKI